MTINDYCGRRGICLILLPLFFFFVYGCGQGQHIGSSLDLEIYKSLNQLEKKIDAASKNRVDKAKFEKDLAKVTSYEQKAVPILSSELNKSKSPERRLIIVWLLAKIGGRDAESILTDKISDPSAKVRAAIAFALGEFDSEKSVEALSYFVVYDNSSDVRQLAILSLGRLGNEKAVEVVKTMLNDKNPVIREAAQAALDRINQ